MVKESEFDVVIIGGGPAGAAAGYWLSQLGRDCIIIEKKTFPREKTCGDGLTPRAVKQLTDMGLADVDLRNGAPAGPFHHLGLAVGFEVDADLLDLGDPFPAEQLLRSDTVRSNRGAIHQYFGHDVPWVSELTIISQAAYPPVATRRCRRAAKPPRQTRACATHPPPHRCAGPRRNTQ